MYPGDILEYYIRAEDDASNASALPKNLSGFDDTSASYERTFTMRGLPTYSGTDGAQPGILFWNDFGRRGGEEEALFAFANNGLAEGVHFDSCTTMSAGSFLSNGLGSAGAHGATAEQNSGYSCVLYDAGNLSSGLLSNGSGVGSNCKSDDVGLLRSWWDTPGAHRLIAHFADNLARFLNTADAGAASHYLTSVINATLLGPDVRPSIGNQTAPRVLPSGTVPGFSTEFVSYGGCLYLNTFDDVVPGTGALETHVFGVGGTSGGSYSGHSAGIYNATTDTDGGIKKSLLFPYGFLYVWDPPSGKVGGSPSARAELLGEILALYEGGHVPIPRPPVAAPQRASFELAPNFPNPFNPKTHLAFTLGREAEGSVKIYNLRGELVRLLRAGNFPAGHNELVWKGVDDRGATVASGIYVVDYRVGGFHRQQKVALLK
jgi:hypothetical protein